MKITGVPGLPIALDGDKGAYYLSFNELEQGTSPQVLLRPPGRKPVDQVVAGSVDEFQTFVPVEVENED